MKYFKKFKNYLNETKFYLNEIKNYLKELFHCLLRRIPILLILWILWLITRKYWNDIAVEICWSIVSVIFIDCIIDTNKRIENKKVLWVVINKLNRIFDSIKALVSNQYDCVTDNHDWNFIINEENINTICENLNLDSIVPHYLPRTTWRTYIHAFSKMIQADLDLLLDRYVSYLPSGIIIKIDNLRNTNFFCLCSNSYIFNGLVGLSWWGFQEAYKDLFKKIDELKKYC